MAHRLIPHAMQINIQAHHVDGGMLLNILAAHSPNALPETEECSLVAGAVKTWVQSTYKTICSRDVKFDQVVVTSLAEVDGPQATESLSPTAGTMDIGSAPLNATLCLKRTSNTAGRRKRGRTYCFPPGSDQVVDPGHWAASYVTDAIDAWNALRDALVTISLPLCIASHVAEADYIQDEFVAVDNVIDSQRRRLPGRGR